jgi:hypothetical protein
MTLPRVSEITGAWEQSPPINWSMSAMAGFKPPDKKTKVVEQDLRDMFGVTEAKGG